VSVLRSPSGRSDHRGSRRGLPASQSGWPVYRGSPVGLPASRSRRAAVPTAVRCPSPPRSRDGLSRAPGVLAVETPRCSTSVHRGARGGRRRALRRSAEALRVRTPRCSSSKRRSAPPPNTAGLFVEAPKCLASERRRASPRGAPACPAAWHRGARRGPPWRSAASHRGASPWSTVALRGVAPRCFALDHRGAPCCPSRSGCGRALRGVVLTFSGSRPPSPSLTRWGVWRVATERSRSCGFAAPPASFPPCGVDPGVFRPTASLLVAQPVVSPTHGLAFALEDLLRVPVRSSRPAANRLPFTPDILP
jgi:hypothetical protein